MWRWDAMSWYLVVIFSVIIMLSFRVGIILSTCSCPNTVQSDHAFGCLNSHCGIKKLSQRVNCCLLRQMCVIGTPTEWLIPSVSFHWLLRETGWWSQVRLAKTKPNWSELSKMKSIWAHTVSSLICLYTFKKTVLSNLPWSMHGFGSAVRKDKT